MLDLLSSPMIKNQENVLTSFCKLSLLMLCLLVAAIATAATDAETDKVKQFVSAFNTKDVDLMLSLAAPDMKWLSVAGHHISVETSSHEDLKTAMTGYFESLPSARSVIRDIRQSGPFVYALEEAFWSAGGTEKSQCSMAVYEFTADKIQHVWYFPAHQC